MGVVWGGMGWVGLVGGGGMGWYGVGGFGRWGWYGVVWGGWVW